MFTTIFKHELKYWLKSPSFYIYMAIFFIASLLIASGLAGIFKNLNATTGIPKLVNSPMGIYNIFITLTTFIFFLFSSILGVSIYRDFKSGMHTILYSYPFTKSAYLLAKFLSGLVVITSIVLIIGIGIFIGFRLPGIDQNLVGAFNFGAYMQTYIVFILPNILLYGAIIFAVVAFSRNITAGFITFIALMLVQTLMRSLLSNLNYADFAALFDPTGTSALEYYTKYWTVAEQNTLNLPLKKLIIYNRIIWLVIASLVFGFVYKFFTFSQYPISFGLKKQKAQRSIKSNFGGIVRVRLPKLDLKFSFLQYLKVTWKLSNIDFKYIVRSIPFIAILLFGIVVVILNYAGSRSFRGTYRLPVTWEMLKYSEGYLIVIIICTFLFAGMLNHRSKTAHIDVLVDTTPIPNWTLVVSKLVALLKMQFVLLLAIMIAGISFQIYNGYTNFEISHYVFDLFILNFSYFMIWAFLALFVQTVVRNPYIGLFLLIIVFLFLSTALTGVIGLEQSVFKYGDGSWYSYSDMNGYGNYLSSYFIYRIYWILGGLLFLGVTTLFLVRGLPSTFKERLQIAISRIKAKSILGFGILLIGFLGMGFRIYYEDNILNNRVSEKEIEHYQAKWEKKYQKFEHYVQPRIVGVKINLDIFPEDLNFNVQGSYLMVNKSNVTIDTILLRHKGYPITFEFDRITDIISRDSLNSFNIYRLKEALRPGDSVKLNFTFKNKRNTALRNNSPVVQNGTLLKKSQLFPQLGYKATNLKNSEIRKQYGLAPYAEKPHPSDTTALGNNMISSDADWIEFEAVVSTSMDQIAIAPGNLEKEWTKGDRRYFKYKVDGKILNNYSFNSGRYKVKKDTWNAIDLEIYYHKEHTYNLDRMMTGMKVSLDYNSKNFGPYQHKLIRIIECPRTSGIGAQAFPNTIPFSESHGFIADVDDTDEGGIDYPFAVTVHEVAHQWWAHQVMGANVLGATMLTESISDYIRLKALEQQHGKLKMRKFLKYALDHYLSGRKRETDGEVALMYTSKQQYIRYSKGAVVFYALSDYIGEGTLNSSLRKFIEKNKFQGPPYPTSIELVNTIKEVVPDTLQYIINDMFETITLYENKLVDVSTVPLENGTYKVDIEFNVSKYRADKKGGRSYSDTKKDSIVHASQEMRSPLFSLPLADYIDLGIFGEEEMDGQKKEVVLYLKKHKISAINNKVTIIVKHKPIMVGIDPYNKLIDTDSDDNRKQLE